jgi:hypothetical protein
VRQDINRDIDEKRLRAFLLGVSGVGLSEYGYRVLVQPGELHCLHQALRPALALQAPHHLVQDHHCCDFSCHTLEKKNREEERLTNEIIEVFTAVAYARHGGITEN